MARQSVGVGGNGPEAIDRRSRVGTWSFSNLEGSSRNRGRNGAVGRSGREVVARIGCRVGISVPVRDARYREDRESRETVK